MASKKFDEFVKQPLDKAAQSISDMTYTYNNTVVPKAHYKKELSQIIEQELDQIVDLKLLNVYVETLNRIKIDSPRLFVQALMCVERGIKIGSNGIRPQEYQALDAVYEKYMEEPKDGLIKEELSVTFDYVLENGTLLKEEKEELEKEELDDYDLEMN